MGHITQFWTLQDANYIPAAVFRMEKDRERAGKRLSHGVEWEKTVAELRGGTHGLRLETARGGEVPSSGRCHQLSWVAGTSLKRESGKEK